MGVSAQNSGFRHFWFRGSAHLRAILWGCRWKPFPGAPTQKTYPKEELSAHQRAVYAVR